MGIPSAVSARSEKWVFWQMGAEGETRPTPAGDAGCGCRRPRDRGAEVIGYETPTIAKPAPMELRHEIAEQGAGPGAGSAAAVELRHRFSTRVFAC